MTLRPREWYPRLADLPGIDFAGSPGADRRRLPGHDAVPQLSDYGLWWPGGSSASPAHERAFSTDIQDFTADQIVAQLWETVELPGAPADYHFALQRGIAHLWSQRKTAPGRLDDLERFAWLDLALVEAAPWSLMWPTQGAVTPTMVALPGIHRLIVLLEQEGAHREAHGAATRLAQLAASPRLEPIEQRIKTLDAWA